VRVTWKVVGSFTIVCAGYEMANAVGKVKDKAVVASVIAYSWSYIMKEYF